jgi:hypothetical protein
VDSVLQGKGQEGFTTSTLGKGVISTDSIPLGRDRVKGPVMEVRDLPGYHPPDTWPAYAATWLKKARGLNDTKAGSVPTSNGPRSAPTLEVPEPPVDVPATLSALVRIAPPKSAPSVAFDSVPDLALNYDSIVSQKGVREFLETNRFTLIPVPGFANGCLFESVYFGIYGKFDKEQIGKVRQAIKDAGGGDVNDMVAFGSMTWTQFSKHLSTVEGVHRTVVMYEGQRDFEFTTANIGTGGDHVYVLHFGAHFSPLTKVLTTVGT